LDGVSELYKGWSLINHFIHLMRGEEDYNSCSLVLFSLL
jgi:hypothetical protein